MPGWTITVLLAGLAGVLIFVAVRDLRSGRTRAKGGVWSRARDPAMYWLCIVTLIICSVVALFMAVTI